MELDYGFTEWPGDFKPVPTPEYPLAVVADFSKQKGSAAAGGKPQGTIFKLVDWPARAVGSKDNNATFLKNTKHGTFHFLPPF